LGIVAAEYLHGARSGHHALDAAGFATQTLYLLHTGCFGRGRVRALPQQQGEKRKS
jgi:hypothetical protein